MVLGDGIRRNIAHVDPSERTALRDAIIEMHHRFYPGARGDTPPGGVSWWFKQDEIHQATHVHGGPEFLPWHRELTNRFEALLRQINPQLSLHYWDFKEDPRNVPNGNIGGGMTGLVNLFDSNFMGSSSGSAGDPWLTAGFYDPQAGTSGHPPDREITENPVDPPSNIPRTRSPLVPGSAPVPYDTTNQSDAIGLNNNQAFPAFRVPLESLHNGAHGYFANVDPHHAFRDPFVYLLHSNVDRIYAQWQTDPNHTERLEIQNVYGAESNADVVIPDPFGPGTVTQNLTYLVEPWSTGIGHYHPIRPWEPTHEHQGIPHDYHDISLVAPPCYDTNQSYFLVQNIFNAATNHYQINFNSVPETETTWRAAVIRIYTCGDVTVRVKPGSEMVAPFSIVVGSVIATQGTQPHLYQDVKIWFAYTAPAVGTAPQVIGPVNTIIEVVGVQDFLFELRADTIPRPTVAVQMVLDQSYSMTDPAGTSGLNRLTVLKDAANMFASIIQVNNGIGIIRFDDDAYPPTHPTYPGLTMVQVTGSSVRDSAHAAINLHGAYGATSIGDGLIMGRNLLNAIPAGQYQQKAILLLTDGLENRPETIAAAVAAGATDTRTYAVGLGNEYQVNTAALTSIAGSAGGKLYLSGVLTPNTDDYFRVRKFFLQILAGVTNTMIVRDPTGYINVGTRIRIPFDLCEADIDCRVILLTDFPIVKLSVETPDGQIIDAVNAAAFGVTFETGDNIKTATFTLPLAFHDIQSGTWNAILEVDDELYRKYVSETERTNIHGFVSNLRARGAQYCLSVHSFSNLRMNAFINQTGFVPGSILSLKATLMEYNQPVERRATVRAELEYPDHTHTILPFAETQPGIFETSLPANQAGIYRFRVMAEGGTYKGVPFTREEILTAATFNEIPPPTGQDGSLQGDGTGVVSAFEKCCRRMGLFIWFIIVLLLLIIIILLFLRR